MAQVVVGDLDEAVVERLQKRAAEHGRTLEGELRLILERDSVISALEFAAAAERFRARFGDRLLPDSAELIRADRDR